MKGSARQRLFTLRLEAQPLTPTPLPQGERGSEEKEKTDRPKIEILSPFCEFSILCRAENFASALYDGCLSAAFLPPPNRIPRLALRALKIDGRRKRALALQGRASMERDPDTKKFLYITYSD
jgi:hypothetical protein